MAHLTADRLEIPRYFLLAPEPPEKANFNRLVEANNNGSDASDADCYPESNFS